MEEQSGMSRPQEKKRTEISLGGCGGIAGVVVLGGAFAVVSLIAVLKFKDRRAEASKSSKQPSGVPKESKNDSSCQEEDEGLKILTSALVNHHGSCSTSNGTSKISVTPIDPRELTLVSPENLILTCTTEISKEKVLDSPIDHQEIILGDYSKPESTASSDDCGVSEESSSPKPESPISIEETTEKNDSDIDEYESTSTTAATMLSGAIEEPPLPPPESPVLTEETMTDSSAKKNDSIAMKTETEAVLFGAIEVRPSSPAWETPINSINETVVDSIREEKETISMKTTENGKAYDAFLIVHAEEMEEQNLARKSVEEEKDDKKETCIEEESKDSSEGTGDSAMELNAEPEEMLTASTKQSDQTDTLLQNSVKEEKEEKTALSEDPGYSDSYKNAYTLKTTAGNQNKIWKETAEPVTGNNHIPDPLKLGIYISAMAWTLLLTLLVYRIAKLTYYYLLN